MENTTKLPVCHCSTASHTPHETSKDGCVRRMVEAPKPVGVHEVTGCPMWEVDGHRITDYSLRKQRGYSQHPDGTWSSFGDSTNSTDA